MDITASAVFHHSSYKAGHHFYGYGDPRQERAYWQSECGLLPHRLEIRLPRVYRLAAVHVLLDSAADESYTPKAMVLQAGSYCGDLRDVREVGVPEGFQGWLPMEMGGAEASCLCILVLENAMNGRDCRIRDVRVTALK